MKSITFIGAGNVAWHLAQALHQRGYRISQVWSRTISSAATLAKLVDAQPVIVIDQIAASTDCFIISMNDEALPQILKGLKIDNRLIVHTSGTIDKEVLHEVSENYGVLYPLQTFSKGIGIDIETIPFFIEANSVQSLKRIELLAGRLSPKVYRADSVTRLKLHMAAVFAGNFSNFMYVIASDLLADSGYDIDILRPLIAETSRKALLADPATVQTGPARRNDEVVLTRHLEMLVSKPEYAEIYRQLTRLIINKYHELDA